MGSRAEDRCGNPTDPSLRPTIRFAGSWASALGIAAALSAPPAGAASQEIGGCEGPGIAGRVTDDTGLVGLPGATVVAVWDDLRRRPSTATTGPDGAFEICGPDDAREATAWAEFADHSSAQRTVRLSTAEASDLRLMVSVESEPAARIVGRVYDADTDDPIAAAAVEVAEGRRATVTNARGDFILTGLPPGRYRLRVHHLGYAEVDHPVDAPSGRTVEVRLGLVREPLGLEPIVVTAVRSRKLEIRGFYERRRWHELLGLGTFWTADDIDRRRPLRISHMIADAPGIRLRCTGSGLRTCRLENARRGCQLNAYIDGVNLRGRSIDEYILPAEVGGIEVYQGGAQLPAEFGGSDARCGAVVIWTR